MLKLISKMARAFRRAKSGAASAVILCAGASTRFSANAESKQMAKVNGIPVIVRTINAFENADSVGEIILVVRKEDSERYKELVIEHRFGKVKGIVIGGETRQISALNGFKHISPKSNYVAIHDGARCLVTAEIIERVVDEARLHRAATAASRVTDTVKLADNDGFICKTLDREYVWNVQTPQVFEAKLYTVSAYTAKEKGIEATDDCMLAEAAGFKVKLVDTGKENIKITHKSDISLAEQILNSREDFI